MTHIRLILKHLCLKWYAWHNTIYNNFIFIGYISTLGLFFLCRLFLPILMLSRSFFPILARGLFPKLLEKGPGKYYYGISQGYSNCSKILNTFLFLFSNEKKYIKMMFIRGGIHKMLFRMANSEDPDQTASSEAV